MKLTRLSRLSLLAVAALAFTLTLAVCAQGQTLTFLANFDATNGYQPFGSVIQATDGNFYGTTTNGGGHGYGNAYRITPSGELTSIYDFCVRPNCADGETPASAPVLGSDGYLYGTTTGGGAGAGGDGSGTVYKMTLDGKIKTLYTFCSLSQCADGAVPNGLIEASDGNFYGTTFWGGNSNNGTIFKISPTGKFTSLYSFCSLANCADGIFPAYPPIEASDGNFYGATAGSPGNSVLYRLTPTGSYTAFFTFCNGPTICNHGSRALTIVQDGKGNFFGTTVWGGANGNYGTVFEVTSTQQFKTLHSFDNTDGAFPNAGLTLASDGNFYGITAEGGPANAGTIFEITAAGGFRTLYTFAPPDGFNPDGPLFQGTDGNFYGATPGTPGNAPYGAVFKFSNGVGPLAETAPGVGKVGQSILILGNGLMGSTSVTFNGVSAAFTVESDTYIKATVPNGATTGTVSVVTPSGTLNSNPQFVVTK